MPDVPDSMEAAWTLAAIVEARLGNLPVRYSPWTIASSGVEMRVGLDLAHAPYAAAWHQARRRERDRETDVINAARAFARHFDAVSDPHMRALIEAVRAYEAGDAMEPKENTDAIRQD